MQAAQPEPACWYAYCASAYEKTMLSVYTLECRLCSEVVSLLHFLAFHIP